MTGNHFHKFYLIGNPVEHSLSPVMHQLFLSYYKINGDYNALLVQPDEIENVIYKLGAEGAGGINVTVPYKETVMHFMDELSEEAQLIGCVNTIKFENGSLKGFNTDLMGFQRSLPVSVEHQKIVMLGAGGVARAILIAFARGNCSSVSIFNRTISRAESLANEIKTRYPETKITVHPLDETHLTVELANASILINTTSVGMKSVEENRMLVPSPLLHQNLFVYDVIYNPQEPPLIKQAKALGLKYVNGLDMLIYQGLESLKIWLDQDLPFEDSLIHKSRDVLTTKLQNGH